MFNIHSSVSFETPATRTTQANTAQAQPQQKLEATVELKQEQSLLQGLRNPSYKAETFLDEAARLTLLARIGVDLETLEELEGEIEELEGLDEKTEEQQEKLQSLLEQRETLFKEALERQNGKILPTGNLVSVTA